MWAMSIWRLLSVCIVGIVILMETLVAHSDVNTHWMYRWMNAPAAEMQRIDLAEKRLDQAIKNPEYMLENWIDLPIAPDAKMKKTLQLSIREAILLALRYNPNIQNAELDRILQRYQLRLAYNAFELQYALAGSAMVTNSNYSGVGNAMTRSYLASPEFNIKNAMGTEAALKMDNNVAIDGNYNPILNFSLKQPLLRGFGREANTFGLQNAIENEYLNKLRLQQSIADQITQVIAIYRAMILSANNLQIQQRQLAEARKAYEINQKNIMAGQLESTANIQQSYQIESLNLMVEQAKQDFKTTAQDLLQAIGLDPNLHLAIRSDIQLKSLNVPDVKSSIAQALDHNLPYLALKMAMRADERAYRAAKNQQLWQLDLTANALVGTVTNVNGVNGGLASIYSGNNVSETANVKLTIPIHDLNQRSLLITAKINLEKDRLNLIAAKRALITTIKNKITMIQSLVKRYELAERQVTLAAQAYEIERKKQQAGIASALDVNHTQNQWTQAQVDLISAKVTYLDHLSALQSLLGTTLDDWQIKLRYAG